MKTHAATRTRSSINARAPKYQPGTNQPGAAIESPQSSALEHFSNQANRSAPVVQQQVLQQQIDSSAPVQAQGQQAQAANRQHGLPAQLKAGIESLSGLSMDQVRVHYNSAQPAQLHAHAYAQGSEIHLAPGQERHLPHEAWHVVQQAQGRVAPTRQMKRGVAVNDDQGLEAEADRMGAKAASGGGSSSLMPELAAVPASLPVAQLEDDDEDEEDDILGIHHKGPDEIAGPEHQI